MLNAAKILVAKYWKKENLTNWYFIITSIMTEQCEKSGKFYTDVG